MEQVKHSLTSEPEDLLSLKEMCLKHKYDYDYLYKKSIVEGLITPYDRGVWKVSESEVLDFSRITREKKLSKIKNRKGDE